MSAVRWKKDPAEVSDDPGVQVGLGVAKPAALLVSQDFFAELRLPYSVKRGERFPLNVTVFNYIDVSCLDKEGKSKIHVKHITFHFTG